MALIQKCIRKALCGSLRPHQGEEFRSLAEQNQSRMDKEHLMPDMRMMISIAPKFTVAEVAGYVKGKSTIVLAKFYGDRKRDFVGQPKAFQADYENKTTGTIPLATVGRGIYFARTREMI